MNTPHEMIQTAARAKLLLHTEGKEAILQFLESQRNPDGGFRGRTAASDLYYTVFGLSSLIALKQPLPPSSTAPFFATADRADLDFVHLAAAARCQMLLGAPEGACRARPYLHRLEAFRSDDGGYHHQVQKAATGTVYGAFLACLAYQETGVPISGVEKLLPALSALRTPDGGFANDTGVAQSTATATSAAILLLHWLSDKKNDDAALAALQRCAVPLGGFRAFERAPAPDLLSTATSLYALQTASSLNTLTTLHETFIESLWDDSGGFCGHAADRKPDVEYTFYALLALGCCV